MKTGNQPGSPQDNGGQTNTQMHDAYAQASANTNNANYQQQAPQQQAPIGGGSRAGGISALLSRSRIGGMPQNGGRDVAELTKKLQEYYDQQKTTELSGVNVRIVPATRGSILGTKNNYSNAVGMILFIVEGSDNRAAHHTLLIASDMSPTPPTRTNDLYGQYAQQQAVAPRTTATLADDALAEVIQQRVAQIMPQSVLFSADWSTVPTNFKVNDPVAVALLFRTRCVPAGPNWKPRPPTSSTTACRPSPAMASWSTRCISIKTRSTHQSKRSMPLATRSVAKSLLLSVPSSRVSPTNATRPKTRPASWTWAPPWPRSR